MKLCVPIVASLILSAYPASAQSISTPADSAIYGCS